MYALRSGLAAGSCEEANTGPHRSSSPIAAGTADFPSPSSAPAGYGTRSQPAYLTWLRSGTPGRERYGITVDAAGTLLWLDKPENVIGGPLAPGPRLASGSI